MKNRIEENYKQLNTLLEYLYDSVYGLTECASLVNSMNFRKYLIDIANERQRYIQEIKSLWDSCEIQPVDKGNVLGPLHRFFIDIKAKIAKNTSQAMKEEILRGDHTLIEKYNSTIMEICSTDIQTLLEQQLKEIQTSLMKITSAA